MFNNPIIQREFIGLLRTKHALILQVSLVLSLCLLVILRWPSEAMVDMTMQQSQQVLRLFGYGMMVALILLAPVFPATTVVRERQQRTLNLLLSSAMSPWSIMIGKLLGVLLFVLLLIILSLPAAAACFTMGGIGLAQLFYVYVVLVLLAVQYAALGLLVSSYAGSTDSSLRITYGLILALSVITLLPHQLLKGLTFFRMLDWLDWVRAISPIPAMMEVLQHAGVGAEGIVTHTSMVGRYAVTAAVLIAVFVGWTVLRFNHRLVDRARSAGKVTDVQTVGVQAYRRIMYLWFFDPQRRTNLIGPLTNPVMVKEFRTRKFGRAGWLMRMCGGCLIVSLALMLIASNSTMNWGVGNMSSLMVIMQISLIILITPSLASGLISGERESGGWVMLQMTPLSPLRILVGKLMSVAITLSLVLIATLPAYVVLYFIEQNSASKIPKVLGTLVGTAIFAMLLSAACSSIFRRTATATAVAYTLLVLLIAGTMLFWLGEDAPFSRSTVNSVLAFNPLAASLSLLEWKHFQGYQLLPFTWYFMGACAATCIVILFVRIWRLSRPQ